MHQQLLPGKAGKQGDVAAPRREVQRLAVGIVEGKGALGALRPCDLPQVPAIQPDAAAHGKVVVQRAAIVPQGGAAVQDEQVVKDRLCAGVGIQLGGAVGVQHPVGGKGIVIDKAGGTAGLEIHGRLYRIGGVCVRQMAGVPLGQQGGQNACRFTLAAGSGVLVHGGGDAQTVQHCGDRFAAGAPQRGVVPAVTGADKGIASHLLRVHRAEIIVFQIPLGIGVAAALDGQHLLSAEQPPV